MQSESHQTEIGRQFAAALDACDYARATAFMTDDCRYERPGKPLLIGRQAICDSYRESDEHARRDFDSVAYRSQSEAGESGGICLTFFDELRRGNAIHTYRCVQIVYFDERDRIRRIEFRQFPEERERLSAFCESHGITLH